MISKHNVIMKVYHVFSGGGIGQVVFYEDFIYNFVYCFEDEFIYVRVFIIDSIVYCFLGYKFMFDLFISF